jgi:hypothetical protein
MNKFNEIVLGSIDIAQSEALRERTPSYAQNTFFGAILNQHLPSRVKKYKNEVEAY